MDQANDVLPASESEVKSALTQLWRAYEYSEITSSNVWEFAVEFSELKEAGVSIEVLRRLICRGYVEHGFEVTEPAKGRREFCCNQNLIFTEYSCFVLTLSGASLARSLSAGRTGQNFASHKNRGRLRPKWNRNREELWFGNTLIKRFRSKAKNQAIILAAFEEQGWPLRIDDPLPPHPGVAPMRRLQDTIKGLNRRQLRTLVRFRGDGTGQGIRWQRAW